MCFTAVTEDRFSGLPKLAPFRAVTPRHAVRHRLAKQTYEKMKSKGCTEDQAKEAKRLYDAFFDQMEEAGEMTGMTAYCEL